MTEALEGYDPMLREHWQNPYDWFNAGYEGCPVHRHDLSDVDKEVVHGNPLIAGKTDHFYTVFGYEDVKELVSNHELFSSLQGPGPERVMAMNEVGMLVYADEPAHRMQRRIVNKAFTPRMVAQLEPRIREICNEIVDAFVAEGKAEMVSQFAIEVPGTVFSEILGVPPKDGPRFKKWADDIVNAFGGTVELQQQSVVAMGEVMEYFIEIIDERRKIAAEGGTPPDDLLTALIFHEADGQTLTDTDLILAIHVFLAGGHETTASGLANAVWLLAEHPDQLELLRKDPSLIPNAVEEMLRVESPIQRMFRTANEDTVFAGCPIGANDKIAAMYGSANRDPRVFSEPDKFDVTRDPAELRKHMAFGFGIHGCVGAALARAELRIGIETLIERLGSWRLDPDNPPVRGGNIIVRTLKECPVVFDVPAA